MDRQIYSDASPRGLLVGSMGIFLLTQLAATTWWASRITVSLDYVNQSLGQLKTEVKDAGLSSAARVQGLDSRISELEKRVAIHETRFPVPRD